MKHETFAKMVAGSGLPSIMGKYARIPLLRRIVQSHPDSIYAQFEILVAANSQVPSGETATVSEEDYQAMLKEAKRILDAEEENLGPVLSALRTVRDLRPAWYAAPLYAEFLEPFDDLLRQHEPYSVRDVFEFAQELEQGNLRHAGPFEKLVRTTGRHPSQIKRPADLWDVAFLIVDEEDTLIALPYKATEVFYRAICRRLKEISPQFLTRKGEALENFVEKRLRILAPGWTYEKGTVLDGKEKDLILWDDQSGLSVECKSLRLRPASTEWSTLNLAKDLEDVRTAMSQAEASMALLKNGGTTPAGKALRGDREVHALIVTDEPYAGYFRMSVDGLSPAALDAGAPWHGDNFWIASFVDLDYAARTCQTISVFLHYLKNYRADVHRISEDEPECLSAYGIAENHALREVGVIETIREVDWDRRREVGIESYRPQWLRRLELVKSLDAKGRSQQAIRIVRQDMEKSIRDYRQELKERRPREDRAEDAQLAESIRAVREKLEATRKKTRLDEPSPYRSL